jgi:hypothetical protein
LGVYKCKIHKTAVAAVSRTTAREKTKILTR